MTNAIEKSEKVQERINIIKTHMKHHLKSIKRLSESVKYQRKMALSPHAPRVIKYSCIPRSEARFQWTIQNITDQVKLLEVELKTLINYAQ